MSQPSALTGIGAILVAFLLAGVLLWLLYRVIKGLFLLLWNAATANRAPFDLLIGAAVAAIAFPRVPRAVVGFIGAFFGGSVDALRSLSGRTFQAVAEFCLGESRNCTMASFAVSERLLGAVGELLSRLLAVSFPLVSAILFCATWALAASASSCLRQADSAPLAFLSNAQRGPLLRGTALTLVAMLGAYLSVTAVMAVPLFDEANRQVSTRFTADALKADLEQVQPVQMENGRIVRRMFPPLEAKQSAAPAGAQPPGPAAADTASAEGSSEAAGISAGPREPAVSDPPPPATGEPAAPAATAPTPQPAEAAPGGPAAPASNLRGLMETEYDRLVAAYASQEEDAVRTAQAYRQSALADFIANNDGRLGSRERARHYSDLYTWYRHQVGALSQQLGACATEVNRYAAFARQLPLFLGSVGSAADGQSIGQAMSAANEAQLRCSAARAPESAMPARKDYGEFLGAIGVMARWLLGTESREVALIVGLVGFGILGAFVSWLAGRKKGDPVEYVDVGSVLMRGFGAAVVVFLGSYGGLAAIAQDGRQPYPSPYVVFFLCLVGAVFSADVWRWARGRLPGNRSPDAPPPRQRGAQGAQATAG